MDHPLLICMTSTRNYGWVTSVFLKANSLWADYIIIADQHSTDGTREMSLKYSNVILLDNDDLEYSETKRSELLISRARQIEGDKILFFLAIDEILSANFRETLDWQKILQSKRGDVFFFFWANLSSDTKHYWKSNTQAGSESFMARLFHDDGITPYNNEGIDMHTHCIPYPKDDTNRVFYVNDFSILHFGEFNEKWNCSKQRYYQLIDFDKNNRSIVVLSRMYNRSSVNRELFELPIKWIYKKNEYTFDMFEEINIKEQPYIDQYIIDLFEKKGVSRYRKLDIWEKNFVERHNIVDKRSLVLKLIHFYLTNTKGIASSIVVRFIDKILKTVGV